jgi:sortase A
LVLLGLRGMLIRIVLSEPLHPPPAPPHLAAALIPPTQLPTPLPSQTPYQPTLPGPVETAAGLETPTSAPTPTSTPAIYPPDRIVIPSIGLDAPVVVSKPHSVTIQNQVFQEWNAPNNFAGGWQEPSASLGAVGNTVINGHNNEYGDVFLYLVKLKPGDDIFVYSGGIRFAYQVSNRLLLRELGQDLETRKANAVWLQPSPDERLTLVTCWPWIGNSHRLIIVARPTGSDRN